MSSHTTTDAIRAVQLSASGTVKADIYSLPDDILLLIISYISVKDIITLRKTTKKLYKLTKLRWVWSDAIKRHVIDKGLLIPAAQSESGVKALSAQALEARAVHAAKFNDNWYSAQPKPRAAIEFSVSTMNAEGNPTAVTEIIFLKGRCGEFIVVWAGDTIEVWEVPLDGSGAYCIATWTHQGGIRQVIVNDDPKHATEIAYLGDDPAEPENAYIWVMALDTFHGKLQPRATMRGLREHISRIHAMYGDFIVMGDPLLVWNTAGSQSSSLTRLRNEARVDMDEVLAVRKVVDNFIVVRGKCIEVYKAPIWSAEEKKYSSQGYITAALAMDAGFSREAVIVVRPCTEESEPSSSASSSNLEPIPPPVTILLAQNAYTLMQLDLLPRRSSHKGSTASYEMPRAPTRVFQVAPSTCQLKVSSGGKGIWIQTHNITNRHAKHPARCIMGFNVCAPVPDSEPISWKPNHCEVSLLLDKPTPEGGSDVHICQSQLYARRCDMGEILRKKYCVVAADLEDSVGRIAVGDRRGKIEVLNFA